MSVLDAGAKARALNTFKGQLHEHLQQLYAATNQGGRSADYFGVDIWKYFNDQVTTDILPGYDNTMLVLTDGYFDFENEAHTMRKKNRFTSTRFYLPWAVLIEEQKAKNDDLGLLPVEVPSNANWLVCGLRAKMTICSRIRSFTFLG